MGRRAKLVLAGVLGGAAFVAVALLLGLALTAPGRERSRVEELLAAQAAGDPARVLALLPRCRAEPSCAAQVPRTIAAARRAGGAGRPEVLRYDASAQVVVEADVGSARVVWRAGALPVVQCVRVERAGPLSGAGVELLALTAPLRDREAGC